MQLYHILYEGPWSFVFWAPGATLLGPHISWFPCMAACGIHMHPLTSSVAASCDLQYPAELWKFHQYPITV